MTGSRINTLFEQLKAKKIVKTRKEFCILLGIDYKTLAKYIDGRVRFSVNSENFEKITKSGVNINWLLTGKGEPFLPNEKKEENAKKTSIEQVIEGMIAAATQPIAERLTKVEETVKNLQNKET